MSENDDDDEMLFCWVIFESAKNSPQPQIIRKNLGPKMKIAAKHKLRIDEHELPIDELALRYPL